MELQRLSLRRQMDVHSAVVLLVPNSSNQTRFSMLNMAVNVAVSMSPNLLDSSHSVRPSSFHNTRRKYHIPMVTPYGSILSCRTRWVARI